MISSGDLVRLHLEDSEGTCAVISRERGEAWLAEYNRSGKWSLVDVPHCHVCGAPATVQGRGLRCERHLGRNPCAIEGCKRTRAAPESGRLSDDEWLCSDHWRRFVPPGSRARRAYHAFFRRAKKAGGFSPELAGQFWRFWEALIRRARRRSTEGFIDEAEIARIMGWDVPG